MTLEELEGEARRICRAFDVPDPTETTVGPDLTSFLVRNEKGEGVLFFELDGITGVLLRLWSGLEDFCSIWSYPLYYKGVRSQWKCGPAPEGSPDNEAMARGLFRLAFEDEEVLAQLPPLSNHQKLELRATLPQEFWPQAWHSSEASR